MVCTVVGEIYALNIFKHISEKGDHIAPQYALDTTCKND